MQVIQMMQQSFPISNIRRALGFALLFALLVPMAIKDGHRLLEHHEHPRCEAKGADRHIHSQEYSWHHCFLCTFAKENFDPPTVQLQKVWVETDFVAAPSLPASFLSYEQILLPALRGPPIMLSC